MAHNNHHLILPLLALGIVAVGAASITGTHSEESSGCGVAPPTKAPTKAAQGPDSGTKNMGSTGWSGGGLGGSHNDTTDAGPTLGSTTDHPATAQGLDPTKPDVKAGKPC